MVNLFMAMSEPKPSVYSERNSLALVQEVEKYPCLYNPKSIDYQRPSIVDIVWEEIGKAVNLPESICKERWKNICDDFRSILKRAQNRKKREPHYLYDALAFLIPFLDIPRNNTIGEHLLITDEEALVCAECPECQQANKLTDANFISSDEDSDWNFIKDSNVEKGNNAASTSNDKERNNIHLSKSTLREIDQVSAYLNSLEPELNEMSAAQLKMFRKKAFDLIEEIMIPPKEFP